MRRIIELAPPPRRGSFYALNLRTADKRRNTTSCYVFLGRVRTSTLPAKSLAFLVLLASPQFNGYRPRHSEGVARGISALRFLTAFEMTYVPPPPLENRPLPPPLEGVGGVGGIRRGPSCAPLGAPCRGAGTAEAVSEGFRNPIPRYAGTSPKRGSKGSDFVGAHQYVIPTTVGRRNLDFEISH